MRECLRQIGLVLAAGLCYTFAFTADKMVIAGMAFAIASWILLQTHKEVSPPRSNKASLPTIDTPDPHERFDETFGGFEDDPNPSPIPHAFPPIRTASEPIFTADDTTDPWD